MPEKIIISESQLKNAIVYGDRWTWAKKLPHNINFMEVGVAAGDFSHFVASNVTLSNLYLVDKYNHIDYRTGWDHIEGIRFDQNTHYDFVSDRFQDFDNVTMLKGSSEDILKDLVDKNEIKFDVIYLDTTHKREELAVELKYSLELLKDNGILAFNDFIVYSELGEKFDTVDIVLEFLDLNKNWEVVGLALDTNMYCDIYLRKKL